MKCVECLKDKSADCFAHSTTVKTLASGKKKEYKVVRGVCSDCLYNNAKARMAERFTEEERLEYRYQISLKHRLKKYNMTIDQFNTLLDSQAGTCKLCGRQVKIGRDIPRKEKACVDHCHKEGNVRGILCHSCNVALGLLGDDPDLFTKAAEYVR